MEDAQYLSGSEEPELNDNSAEQTLKRKARKVAHQWDLSVKHLAVAW